MEIKQRLNALRNLMRTWGIDGYIIEGTDPHHSEYPALRWETRAWITGFTGSAGIAVITLDGAHLWVDPRYHLQAEQEVSGTGIILHKVTHPGPGEVIPVLISILKKGRTLGLSKEEITLADWRTYTAELKDYGISCILTDDLCEGVWEERPPVPAGKAFEVPISYAGTDRQEKLKHLRKHMQDLDASWYVVSSLDDIAWVLNIRGSDVEYNPLCLSYLFIGTDKAVLCADKGKFSDELVHALHPVEITPYEQAAETLSQLLHGDPGKVLLDPRRTAMLLAQRIEEASASVERPDITSFMKARKNQVELKGMQEVHVQDGAALASFLFWLENHWQDGTWNEVSLGKKLLSFREKQKGFYQESFSPIIGYLSHGAVIHYRAQEPEAFTIDRRGLMIIDSGGQYFGGTTDITRTVLFGEPEEQEIHDYTLVLKGHLKLSRTPFPEGTRGFQLDTLARMFLWEEGMHYGHGTGHGIGHMLCVHEGPGSISTKPLDVPIEEGMVLSNEPGLYREGRYGIRIENLIFAVQGEDKGFGRFLKWETLTLCPYEQNLIDCSLLTPQEIRQVDEYHNRVYRELSPHLNEEETAWLYEKTRPLTQQL